MQSGMASKPYLSFVATSRNDDHGVGMLQRMQIFTDSLIAQAERHRLPCELLLVEWNPPEDRPSLKEALPHRNNGGFCDLRIVTVPAELHRKFAHSDKLPLFQMIAKNVGIRRARGEFILATNVDLIFSDPLMRFLAERCLRAGTLYRSDRVDVDRNVPTLGECGGLDAQLEYCRTHVLRANRKDGTWVAPEDGQLHTVEDLRPPEESDPARRGIGLLAALERTLRTNSWPGVSFSLAVKILLVLRRTVARLRFYRHSVFYFCTKLPGLLRSSRGFRARLQIFLDELLIPLRQVPPMHTNACGDFTLLDKQSWIAIGGNPELEMYSFHLDSLTLHSARAAGISSVDLGKDMVHFHIEHGGGWTPSSEAALYQRMSDRGIPMLRSSALLRLQHRLYRKKPVAFHGSHWGLENHRLPDSRDFSC